MIMIIQLKPYEIRLIKVFFPLMMIIMIYPVNELISNNINILSLVIIYNILQVNHLHDSR